MLDHAKLRGIFSPEDLNEMSQELDRGAAAGETLDDREMRAEAILCRADAERARSLGCTNKALLCRAPRESSPGLGR